jgi:hypothetical protein
MSQSYPYGVGIQNVGSYQSSGTPFASSSIAAPSNAGTPTRITFPEVTQRIFVSNITSSSDLRVGFSANGVKGTNYFVIKAGSAGLYPTQEFRVKVSEIYLLSHTTTPTSASVFAELTNISTTLLLNSGPSGSSWSGSVGVG